MAVARLVIAAIVLIGLLTGCGGPEDAVAPPTGPPEMDDPGVQRVGPLVVRTASAAGFVAQAIPAGRSPISFVALHGSTITYLASQAMLDRVVFSRGFCDDFDLWVCNLDGSNAVRLINNTAADCCPSWSPDGRRIVFSRARPTLDTEIVVMNADGSGPVALTDNADRDADPTWSPEGRRIAFETDRTGNSEIFVMYDDGSGAVNLTQNPARDIQPDWTPAQGADRAIAFVTDRGASDDIYTMREDGSSQWSVTSNSVHESVPAWDPTASGSLAWQGLALGHQEIFIREYWGDLRAVTGTPGGAAEPAWSSDRRFICFSSAVGYYDLALQELDTPQRQFTITHSPGGLMDRWPDLGSPTLQTDRVIIGPAGSDWGGGNPPWASAYAVIAAFGEQGYLNLVRIGIRPGDLDTLQISPLASPAQSPPTPIGVVVEAAEVVNVREDGGRGNTPVLWQLDALDPTAAILYFDPWSGKLQSVLVVADQSYPTGARAAGPVVTQRAEGGALVAEGSFVAVLDGTGARIADAASVVRLADGAVTVVR